MSKNDQSRLRNVIFRNILGVSALFIIVAGVLLFGSARLTEDYVLSNHLERRLDTNAEYVGSLADMPAQLQAELEALPTGHTELSADNREIQVLKRTTDGIARYALISTIDTNYVPLTGWLFAGAVITLLFAYILSTALSRHLTTPLEKIVDDLESNKFSDGTAPAYEFAVITERIRRFQTEQANRLHREVGFTRSVSHELRTPMTVIHGALDLLQDEPYNQAQEPRLQRIRLALTTLEHTTEALLKLTRAEHRIVNQGMTVQQSLREVITENLDDSDTTFDFTFKLSQSIADWPLLVVAVGLLVRNVASHANAKSATVRVTDEGAEVSDDGVGILNSAVLVNNLQAGSHLGFGILHRICERCDWRLTIESEKDAGTTVRLSFYHAYIIGGA